MVTHRPMRTLLLASLLAVAALPAAADDPSPLKITATAKMKSLAPLGEQSVELTLKVKNPSDAPAHISSANLLVVHEGGWLAPQEPKSLDGSFLKGTWEFPAGGEKALGSWDFRTLTPATHALLAVRHDNAHQEITVPIVRDEFETPGAYAVPYPYGVGIVAPLEVVPFSDGQRSILLVGQHQVLTGARPENVKTRVFIGDDAGSSDPTEWEGLDAQGDLVALWPFVRRIDVYESFASGYLRIESEAEVDGAPAKFVQSWMVEPAEPELVESPVLGGWQLGNGPGQTSMHPHYAEPQLRYAYDMVVTQNGLTHKGDPHNNESYFAWNRTIRAVADGVVHHVCDHEPDNPGFRGAMTECYNNRVVIKHDNGLYTAYVHIRQKSGGKEVRRGIRVKAGQTIARVGNSGRSSEPHLNFMAYRIDKWGRIRSVPVAFTNAFHDAEATKPVEGVPVGGQTYYFQTPPTKPK